VPRQDDRITEDGGDDCVGEVRVEIASGLSTYLSGATSPAAVGRSPRSTRASQR
jgi:hypothetical protein